MQKKRAVNLWKQKTYEKKKTKEKWARQWRKPDYSEEWLTEGKPAEPWRRERISKQWREEKSWRKSRSW